MADTVPITAGAGTTIATDDCGAAGHAQRIKIDSGGVDGAFTDSSPSAPFPVKSGVTVRVAAATFNRPANTTAYSIGDLVADNTTAASVTRLSFTPVVRQGGAGGMIRRAKIRKSTAVLTGASFRLHLFSATVATVTNGDNGVFSVSGAADYLGAIDVIVDQAFTDGAVGVGTPRAGGEINLDLPSTNTGIFGLLEARGAYTPGSAETFAVELEIIQD